MLIACTVLVNNDEDDDAVAVGEWEKVKLRTMAEVCLLVVTDSELTLWTPSSKL